MGKRIYIPVFFCFIFLRLNEQKNECELNYFYTLFVGERMEEDKKSESCEGRLLSGKIRYLILLP
jgi:hypothetical protein